MNRLPSRAAFDQGGSPRLKATVTAFTHARRTVVGLVIAALVLAGGLSAFVSAASLKSSAGHTGQALALRSAMHQGSLKGLLSGPNFTKAKTKNWWPHLANGRLLLNGNASPFKAIGRQRFGKRVMQAGGNPNPILINEGVQTFDVFAPPPSFVPTPDPLTPTNLHPIYTRDENYIYFSSNRGDGVHYHIYAIGSRGGPVFQITGGNGNEFFPSLNVANSVLAFISNANAPQAQPNRYDLYIIGGQSGVTMPAPLGSGTPVDVGQLDVTISPSLNSSMTQGVTDFTTVARPTLSPTGDRIVFTAHTAPGAAGHVGDRDHLYFLYTNSRGFQQFPSPGTANPPAQLTDGSANDDNPAWSQDGNFVAFDSTANQFNNTGQSLGQTTSPTTSDTQNGASPATGPRGIFLLNTGGGAAFGTVPPSLINQANGLPNGRVTQPGNDDITPAWSDIRANDFFNPSGGFQYLTFARGPAAGGAHDIVYFRLTVFQTQTNTTAITPETAPGGGNAVIKLNTDDNAGQTSQSGNAYDDTYPAWSPFQSIFTIVYQSPRSVTYNTPSTNIPVETAISLAPGTNGVGAGYVGLLESQVFNLDPPTMLRYSASETIHITDAQGNVTRFIQPSVAGSPQNTVTFTIRLSNREAGIDNTNGPGGGPNVYIQIKDPDSKYQDSQGLEHKVFANCNDVVFKGNNSQNPIPLNSGTSLYLFDPGGLGWNVFNNAKYPQVGAVAGTDPTATSDTLSVGHIPPDAGPNNDGSFAGGGSGAAAVYYNNYRRWGPEYECQWINPTRANPFNAAGDYGVPFYLAGVDDATPLSGYAHPPRPAADNANTNTAAEWLQLQRVPDAQQDGLGGVLYTATYAVPTSPSDFYLDVIAYDNAVFPALPTFASNFNGTSKNWRIYDNTGGFTTVPFDGSNDILVVSDNALGQKFSFTTFGGGNGANLTPTLYGAESYYTDVDVSLLPNAIDTNVNVNNVITPTTRRFSGFPSLNGNPNHNEFTWENGLGANSHNDDLIDDGGRVSANDSNGTSANLPNGTSQVPFVRVKKYSLWRILCRGAIPSSVLGGYQPTFVSQPAVSDTVNNVTSAANPNVPVANRCVIWVSPYTGDLPLVDAGSLENPTTQQTLQAFVNAGGRLCITGQDVAASLSLKDPNSANTFLTQTLGAKFATNGGGSQILGSNGNRLSGFSGGPVRFNYLTTDGTTLRYNFGASPPSNGPLHLSNGFGTSSQDLRADSSLDQTNRITPPPNAIPFRGNNPLPGAIAQIDTITPNAGTTLDMTTNGQPGLIYYENYTTGNGNFDGPRSAGFGSRIVFGSFGMEGVSQEVYSFAIQTPKYDSTNNYRSKILHNIVNYLRTGTFAGRITQANGSGVSGATVYVRPTGNIPNPRPQQVFSATTDFQGNYVIAGLEPAYYSVTAYKQGFTTSTSNGTFGIEGDVTVNNINLVISPQPPGAIAGTTIAGLTGLPLAGVTVTFKSTDGQTTVGPVVSGPDGKYTINNVPVGTYNGTASKPPRYADATAPVQNNPVTVTSGATAPADFVLQPKPATVTGVVFDDSADQNGLPRDNGEAGIANATVTFTRQGGGGSVTTTTDNNGAYTISIPTPGTYSVVATKATFKQKVVITKTLDYGDVTTQDIPLVFVAPGRLLGRVTDPVTNAGVPNATVTFTSQSNPPGPTLTATTDANGNYDINPASADTYTAVASAPGYNDTAPVTVTVGSGQTVTQNFVLQPKPATVTGEVFNDLNDNGTLDTGEPGLGGATVTFTPTRFGAPATATSASDGTYTVQLVEGTYTVTATKAGFRNTRPQTVTVGPGGSATVNVPLIIPPGLLGGLVTDSFSGQAISGVKITVTDSAGNPAVLLPGSGPTTTGTVTTGPDGQPINYGPLRLAPGTYKITATPPIGYQAATVSNLVVVSDKFTRADVALAPLHVFGAGLNFFSVPYDFAGSGVSIDQIFGKLNQGTFLTNPPVYNPSDANRSHVFVYQPRLLQYVVDPTPPADGLHLGQGYWVFLRAAREVNFTAIPPGTAPVSVGLARGWNMIGVPSLSPISLSRLNFANPAGGGSIPFDQASDPTFKIVSPTLYAYTGSSTNPYAAVTTGSQLQPWQAYWIYAYVDTTVIIPTSGP